MFNPIEQGWSAASDLKQEGDVVQQGDACVKCRGAAHLYVWGSLKPYVLNLNNSVSMVVTNRIWHPSRLPSVRLIE